MKENNILSINKTSLRTSGSIKYRSNYLFLCLLYLLCITKSFANKIDSKINSFSNTQNYIDTTYENKDMIYSLPNFYLINNSTRFLQEEINFNNSTETTYSSLSCEINTGPNLDICSRSDNTTHKCCLAVPRNGNGESRCGPVPKDEITTYDNSDYNYGVDSYILYCISDDNVNSHFSTEVETSYEVETGIAGFTSFVHNCGNVLPEVYTACTAFSTDDEQCCMIVSTVASSNFRICMLMPLEQENLQVGSIQMTCSVFFDENNATANNSKILNFTFNLIFFLLYLLICFS